MDKDKEDKDKEDKEDKDKVGEGVLLACLLACMLACLYDCLLTCGRFATGAVRPEVLWSIICLQHACIRVTFTWK